MIAIVLAISLSCCVLGSAYVVIRLFLEQGEFARCRHGRLMGECDVAGCEGMDERFNRYFNRGNDQ